MIILPDFRIHQRDYLLKISRAITAQLDLDVVLRMVLEASVSMLGGEIGMIALRNLEDQLEVQATLGVEADKVDLFAPLLELAHDEDTDQNELQLRVRLLARRLDMNLRQVVSLPMRISGEMLGIVYVFRSYPGNPTPDDMRILESFADQAAIAVHNAGLYQASLAERQRLSTILDASADGIMILDASGRVMRLNSAMSLLSGWQANLALDRQHKDIVRWADPAPEHTLEGAMRDGWPVDDDLMDEDSSIAPPHAFYVEGNLERLDGRSVSVEIKYAPVFFEDGSLRNIIANVRDITRFREAEELKDTFISVVSHELKTPVALIKGYASTLRRDDAVWDTDTIHRGLEIIEEESDRLTELIENLLMATRLQVEGIVNIELEEVALDHLAASVVERYQTQTDQHAFHLEFDDDFPHVKGDTRRLRHVLDNLVANAIKYSPDGGDIRIEGHIFDDHVQVVVEDEGIGIPEEDEEQVFERFYRTIDARRQGIAGTGLGLYLVRAIIEAHGGRIWATSHQPGTSFTFTLPRQ